MPLSAREERALVEGYLAEHQLEATLNDVVNDVVKNRPSDPYLELGSRLMAASPGAHAISRLSAWVVLDGWGRACLQVQVTTQRGNFVASTSAGPYDEDGVGLSEAADSVRSVLADTLLDMDVTNQAAIDSKLADADDAPSNAVLACSMACCKAGAAHLGICVHSHISTLAGGSTPAIPMPCVAVVNGGRDARTTSELPFEEIMVVPHGAIGLRQAIEMVATINAHIPDVAAAAGHSSPLMVGKRGAYELQGTPGAVMQILQAACEAAQLAGEVSFSVDAAAPTYASCSSSEDQEPTVVYEITKFADAAVTTQSSQDSKALLATYVDLLANFRCCTLEDPFSDRDVPALLFLKEKVDVESLRAAGQLDEQEEKNDDTRLRLEPIGGDANCKLQIAGDLVCQVAADLDKYDEQKTINTLCLTLRKGKTVSGCIELATKARSLGQVLHSIRTVESSLAQVGHCRRRRHREWRIRRTLRRPSGRWT